MIYSSKGSYVHPCMKGVVYACSCQQIISFNYIYSKIVTKLLHLGRVSKKLQKLQRKRRKKLKKQIFYLLRQLMNLKEKTSTQMISLIKDLHQCAPLPKTERNYQVHSIWLLYLINSSTFSTYADCEEGEWDPEWDEETNDDHPNIKKEHTLMYV